MDWFFDQWVKGTDIPAYRVAWTSQVIGGGKYAARLRIKQEHVSTDFRMPVVVSVDIGENRFANFRVEVRGDQIDYMSPLLPGEPRDVKFNVLNSVLADVKMEGW
jgi:hypothetical protein